MSDEVLSCTGEEAVEGSLAFLHQYASRHFADEETLMQRSGYPGLDSHKGLHVEFIERLESLVDDSDIYRAPGQDMADEILDLTQGWLIDHILNEDVQYVSHVKSA